MEQHEFTAGGGLEQPSLEMVASGSERRQLTELVSLRLPAGLHDVLSGEAERRRESLASTCRGVLAEALDYTGSLISSGPRRMGRSGKLRNEVRQGLRFLSELQRVSVGLQKLDGMIDEADLSEGVEDLLRDVAATLAEIHGAIIDGRDDR